MYPLAYPILKCASLVGRVMVATDKLANVPFCYYQFNEKGHALKSLLPAYHSKIKNTLVPLPSTSPLREVADRIIRLAKAPLAYPILGLKTLAGSVMLVADKWMKDREPSGPDNDIDLQKKVDTLRKNGTPNWKEDAIDLIRKGRHDNLNKEMNRLYKIGIFNSTSEPRIDQALLKVRGAQLHSSKNRQKVKILIGQALEIKRLYGEKHHVFIHAQSTNWIVFSHLVKEFVKIFQPNKALTHHYKFLRVHSDKPTPDVDVNLDLDFNFLTPTVNKLKKSQKTSVQNNHKPTVQKYIASKSLSINDDNAVVREELLSVDAFFYNRTQFESSLDFLSKNDNVRNNTDLIKKFITKAILHFNPKMDTGSISDLYYETIIHAASKISECGNLFVICIPKEQSQKIAYRAHAYGPVCTCHPEPKNLSILNTLQQDTFNYSTKCNEWARPIPHYRLYTPLLKPDGEKRIFLLTPFSKKVRTSIKDPIKRVVKIVYDHAQRCA